MKDPNHIFRALSTILIVVFVSSLIKSQTKHEEELGKYFYKKQYVQSPLPSYDETKNKLPSPIYDENTLWVDLYWKAWEIAFKNFYEPTIGSGFVSQFIDAAFNENIFLWDTGFMTMFCNLAHPLVPGIGSLDNFYCKQHEDGEICREIDRKTGLDYKEWVNKEDTTLFSRWGWNNPMQGKLGLVTFLDISIPRPNPKLTLDALNHPLLAWAELESYKVTGNKTRLKNVLEPLKKYYEALKKYIRQGDGLYVTDWASMDNSPRNNYIEGGGCGIDISAEMVLFAKNLSEICSLLVDEKESKKYANEARVLSEIINLLMWNNEKKFYFDLDRENKKVPIKTVAGFWTLIAGIASSNQAKDLVSQLKNPYTFGRLHPIPTCSADEDGYDSKGGYWRGAVWAPTNTMVIRGLEKYGYRDFAREIAIKHLEIMSRVFKETGTIWENYEPDSIAPGKTDNKLVAYQIGDLIK